MRLVVAIVLLASCQRTPDEVLAEFKQRSAYVRDLAKREGFVDAWSLNSRDNLSFESGVSNTIFINPQLSQQHWFDFDPPVLESMRGLPVRFMNRSVHLRVRGDGPMTLSLGGMINTNAVYTKPRLELSLDGALLTSQVVDAKGKFAVSVDIPAADVKDWADVYLTWTALQDPERESGEPRVARLEYVHWERTP